MEQIVFAVSGVKNSGKTTMVEKLVRALTEKGYRVATIKHDAHSFDADVPGRDSYRHKAAGAYGTAVFDKEKFMVIKEGEQTIEGLIAAFPEADIIVLEGARETDYPKVEVVRAGNSKVPVSNLATMLALATDLPLTLEGVPTVHLNDTETLVSIVLERLCK